MIFIILWILVWAGMYTGPYKFAEIYTFWDRIHALRAFLPLFALLWSIPLIIKKRYIRAGSKLNGYTQLFNPFYFLFFYGAVGLAANLISVRVVDSFYWNGVFLAPFFVIFSVLSSPKREEYLWKFFEINYFLMVFFTLVIFFGPMIQIIRGAPNPRVYELPFNMGTQTANGVGRFAVVALIVSLTRILSGAKGKLFYYVISIISFLNLIYSQSRTALYGGFVAIMLVLFSLGWVTRNKTKAILIFGVMAYFIFVSAYKWRAHGEEELLFHLSGRENTWRQAVAVLTESPIVGFGFQSDRFLLEGQHIHNAFIQALVQAGLIGLCLYFLAYLLVFLDAWKILKKISHFSNKNSLKLAASAGIAIFFALRGLAESSAAFYGIDLLVLLPTILINYDASRRGGFSNGKFYG